MSNSLDHWNRVPTASAAIFGIVLPYRPPKNPIAAFLWRKRMLLETTIGLCLLEPWEKILVLSIIYLLITLIFTGFYKFVPQAIANLHHRSLYYFFGQEAEEGIAVQRFVAGWIAQNSSGEL